MFDDFSNKLRNSSKKQFKVAHVVNIKGAFTDIAQSLPRSQVICPKIENLDKLQVPYSLIFFAEFCTRFLLNNIYKRLFGTF